MCYNVWMKTGDVFQGTYYAKQLGKTVVVIV